MFEEYNGLKAGRSEDQRLAESINGAMNQLLENPELGVKIPRHLWPKEYTQEYEISNLWKCNLRQGWRLIYTIAGNQIEIVSIILEWFPHKEYENRFKYKVR